MNNTSIQTLSRAFELKGSMFTLTVLHLLSPDLKALSAQLDTYLQQTPNFFNHMPIVIDLKEVNQKDVFVDFPGVQACLREHGLIPVGIRHGNEVQNLAAQATQLAVLPPEISKRKSTKADLKNKALSDFNGSDHPQNLVISHPVRSGQQIYAKNANLIILSSVSNGAELLADGHIHVYGNLRGRALAGVRGDTSTRIFCHKLEAELVSIAGYYKLRDDLPTDNEEGFMQIYLDDKKICIEGISSVTA